MNLVQTSLAASVMILLVLLLRGLLLYRWPKKAFAALWMLVLLRLLLPFQWQAPWQASLLQAPDPVRLLQQDAPPAQAGDGQQGQEGQQTRQLPWHLLWAAGAAGCGVFWLTVYRRGRRRFSMALPVENPSAWQWLERHPLRRPVALRQTDQVEGPLTYGLFRPVILLPKALASAGPQLLECVLAHEWTHIRRWDAGKKLLLAAGLCLHWFNPLVWVFFFMANRDLELACDEGAIALLGGQQRGRYARTLIQMEEVRSGLLTPFGGNRMKERVKAIMKGKNRRRTMVSVVPAGMLLALVALALSAKPGTSSPLDGQTVLGLAIQLEGDTLSFDPAEWVTISDTERIQELGIDPQEMPNGYYIENPEADRLHVPLAQDTEYCFFDWGRQFIQDPPAGEGMESLLYTTTKQEEFLEYLNSYTPVEGEPLAGKVPFWIQVEKGRVRRITEQYVP